MSHVRTLSFEPPGHWRQAGQGRFRPVAPGVLESEGGPGALWYAPEAFTDVVLEVEWRATTPEDNSGVFLRFPATELVRAEPDWKAGPEVQIDDRGVDHQGHREGSPLHLTGALYGHLPARAHASHPTGRWNHFLITLQGRELRVVLNGTEVCAGTVPPGLPASGHLALQDHHPGSRVQFRAPRLRVPAGG